MSNAFIVTDNFTINGVNYQQKAMDPLVAAQLWPKVAALIVPVIAAQYSMHQKDEEGLLDVDSVVKAMSDALTAVERDIAKLVAAFEPCCKVEYVAQAPAGVASTPTWMPVRVGRDFVRKHVDLVEWLVTCIKNEFADFLSEAGRNRFGEMVSNFSSQTS